ncbi:MAG: cation:proton antiporter [Nannocystaceae bacterium]|nr:cation:proton antiporter [bacterium]
MRRLFVVLALLIMMLGLEQLRASESTTLAAIGFVVLAAFAIAELGGRMSLPKVTGYIVSGVILGPFAGDVLTTAVVVDMNMFGTLALGLIATTAGLELELKGLARLTKTLAATIGLKIVLCALLVGGAIVGMGLGTDLLGLSSDAQVYGLAMILTALAIGTSPAIALAVASESNANGRLTELVLGAAVAKDVVVVVAFNVGLATALAMSAGGELGLSVLTHVGLEIAYSVIAGAILGGLLIAYLRFVKTEMLLFVTAMVLVVAEAASYLKSEHHIILELLLVFIVAGMMVRNITPKLEHDLLDPLKTVSLPVFIVFFTNAGAKIDLGATWSVLPAALVVCVARGAAYFISGRLGGRMGGEEPKVQRLAWLAYLPQAGVALTLLALAAGRFVEQTTLTPEAASTIQELAVVVSNLGIAVVAINLLVGPITLRIALRNAGEIKGEAKDDAQASAESEEEEAGPDLDALESPRLRALVTETEQAYLDAWSPWLDNEMRPKLAELIRQVAGAEGGPGTDADKVLARIERLRPSQYALEVESLREVLLHQSDYTQTLPVVETVPLEAHLAKVDDDDDLRTKARKRLAAFAAVFSGRNSRKRQIPVQLAVRYAFEPRMVTLAESTLRSWHRHEARCLETLQRAVLGTATWEETRKELLALETALETELAEDREAATGAAKRALIAIFSVVGAPGRSTRAQVRFSRVERDIEASLARMGKDAAAWPTRQKAAITLLEFVAAVERAQARLQDRLRSDVTRPLDDAFETLTTEVGEELNRLGTIVLPDPKELDDEQWTRIGLQSGAVLTKPAAKQLRAASSRVRRATSTSSPFAALMAFVNDGEPRLEIVPSLSDLIDTARPATVSVVSVDVRELKEVHIAGRLLPSVEQRLESVHEQFSAARDTMREAATLVSFGFQTAEKAREEGDNAPLARLEEALTRARTMLEALPEGPCLAWSGVRDELSTDVDEMSQRLVEAARAVARGQRSEVETLPTARERAVSFFKEALASLRGLVAKATAFFQGGTAGDLAERYRLRAQGKKLDAQTVRSLLDEQRKRRLPGVDGLYASLFTPGPLRDPRLFALHREQLRATVKAERAWQSDTRKGNGALVIGPVGSGKTSTLVIAQLKLSTRRVFTLRHGSAQDESIWHAMGRSFDVDPTPEALAKVMGNTRSVMLVDDLHTWFTPDRQGVSDLRRFLCFMAERAEQTFWLASIAEEAMEVLRALAPIESAFGSIVRLGRPAPEQLDEAISARHDLAGMGLELPRNWRADLRRRLLRRTERSSYAQDIASASSGNLRRALQLWLAHASVHGESVVLETLSGFAWGVPFLARLPNAVLAVLATLMRHGPTSVDALARCSGLGKTEVVQAVRFAAAATLIRETERAGHYEVDPAFSDDVALGLQEAGIFRAGVAA